MLALQYAQIPPLPLENKLWKGLHKYRFQRHGPRKALGLFAPTISENSGYLTVGAVLKQPGKKQITRF